MLFAQHCRDIAQYTGKWLDQLVPGGYSRNIDLQVYSKKQCFRVLGSCKFSETTLALNNRKKQYDVIKSDGKYALCELNEDEDSTLDGDENLLQSLVSYVDCIPYRTSKICFWATFSGGVGGMAKILGEGWVVKLSRLN